MRKCNHQYPILYILSQMVFLAMMTSISFFLLSNIQLFVDLFDLSTILTYHFYYYLYVYVYNNVVTFLDIITRNSSNSIVPFPSSSTSLIISCNSASVGFCPKDRITVANSYKTRNRRNLQFCT